MVTLFALIGLLAILFMSVRFTVKAWGLFFRAFPIMRYAQYAITFVIVWCISPMLAIGLFTLKLTSNKR